MMALGNSSERALNWRFIFWRSRHEWADTGTVLGTFTGTSGTAAGMKTSLIAAENEPVMTYIRSINQDEKGGIDLQILLHLKPGVFLSDSDMVILKNHTIPSIESVIISLKNLTIPRTCTAKE